MYRHEKKNLGMCISRHRLCSSNKKPIFTSLDPHMLDTPAHENHVHKLIKMVALCYIRIKRYHEGKKFSEKITRVSDRKRLTKLSHFLHM